jgi:hypothetical protein
MGTIAGSGCAKKLPPFRINRADVLAIREVKPETTKVSPDIAELKAKASTFRLALELLPTLSEQRSISVTTDSSACCVNGPRIRDALKAGRLQNPPQIASEQCNPRRGDSVRAKLICSQSISCYSQHLMLQAKTSAAISTKTPISRSSKPTNG